MTYGIDKDSENYDESASNNRIKEHKLSSTYVETQTSYCVGKFKDNELYLTPIDLVFQMRPDFEHVNKESNERVIGSNYIDTNSIKAKGHIRMQIVDDGKREQLNHEMNLANEEEVEVIANDQDSMQAQQIIEAMQSTGENETEKTIIKIPPKRYLDMVLNIKEQDDMEE